MTDIILLNGGPRKNGNTMRIAEWVAEGARTQGAQVEVIHLVDQHIEHCRGCDACARTGAVSSRTTTRRFASSWIARKGRLSVRLSLAVRIRQ
jgi:transcriptional regulator GlxA family with amidase domain